jgi:quinol-cytochrome oxidoreductase complex cytochrome b subunit
VLEQPRTRLLALAVLAAGAVLLAVLVASGIWLALDYRPDLPGSVETSDRIRSAHRVASHLLVTTAFVALVVVLVARGLRRRWFVAVAAWVLALAGSFTGFLLPWDQLALRSITTGEGLTGIRWLFDDEVRFVLVDGVEVAPATYARWAVVHAAVFPLVALVLAVATVVVRRRRALTR